MFLKFYFIFHFNVRSDRFEVLMCSENLIDSKKIHNFFLLTLFLILT